jgi:hypothetical protein
MPDLASKEQVLPTADGDYVLFRSTLEFRWAMAFEFLKIDWYYEPNRFPLPNGTYLPDFYLPEIGWIEIKPTFEELKKAESKLRTFARHKSQLLNKDIPFYSITSEYPTFRISSRDPNTMLLEWLANGKIRKRGRDHMIDNFRSQEKTALYEASRSQYVDFVDRSMSMAQEAHISEPLPVNAVMKLALRSMEKAYIDAPEEPEESEEVQPAEYDLESGVPF